jgi:hypothetical protein
MQAAGEQRSGGTVKRGSALAIASSSSTSMSLLNTLPGLLRSTRPQMGEVPCHALMKRRRCMLC